LETIQESYAVDLNGQNFLRVCRNDLNFCVWVVKVFDDEMRIVRSRIMHEERDEMFIVPVSVFKLKFAVVTDGCNVLSSNVTVIMRFYVSGSEGSFAGETRCGGVVGFGLFVG